MKIAGQEILFYLKTFITLNGTNLKHLSISGKPNDRVNLGELAKSIGQQCLNLEYLSICYRNKEIGRLIGIFNGCSKLKHISFSNLYSGDYILNGIKILAVLNKSLSKSLNTLKFEDQVNIIKDESLNQLMRDWRGPRPFKIFIFGDEIVF
nr:1647_t:CDS:1 [Entrophospora candida]